MTAPVPSSTASVIERDVIILGAGPAGLSAAMALRKQGITSVSVLEREAEAGGIPRHCGHPGYGLREFSRLMTGPGYARALAEAAGDVDIRLRTAVLKLEPGGVVRAMGPDGPVTFRGRAVLLALGARETPRSARLVSGTRPWGVMNTGALQQFVYLHKTRPFERPVIIGSELVAFSTLVTLRHVGVTPVAMLEAGPRITAYRPGDWIARTVFGAAILLNTRLLRILGGERVEAVEIDRGQGPERLDCDGVVFTGQFRPESALLVGSHLARDLGTQGPAIDQFWRCSDPSFFAAGNLLRGIETAGQCFREGRAAARAIAAELDGKLPPTGMGVPVETRGVLSYVYPQRIADAEALDGKLLFLARAREAARGQLVLQADNRVIWSKPINALPERRIRWSVDPRQVHGAGKVTVTLENVG
jgi:NADPH-dependent 2,4-dienoyl-CoA reductase/sulfur reductase-like enzyme